MELLHRLAIALVAALLVFSIAFAAGRIANGDRSDAARRFTPAQAPAASVDAASRGEHVLRLGRGAPTGGVEAPPLVAEPTPAPQP
jgi:hypothetical protein